MGSCVLAVLVCTPAGQTLQTKDIMTRVVILLLVAQVTLGARQLRGNGREAKSLTNTFPFNSKSGAEPHHEAHHGAHHGDHEQSVLDLDNRASRQGDDTPVDFPAVAGASPGSDGKRCIDKVEMVEETEYDETVQCDHSYSRRRTVRRTSGRAASSSTSRSPSTRRPRCAELPSSRTATSRAPRSAGPSTSPSAGPSRRFMTCRMMWSTAGPRLKRSVRTRPPATPPTPSAPSDPRRCAPYPRSP